jgi:glycosyltransferase involved in cell wall biosynthesis
MSIFWAGDDDCPTSQSLLQRVTARINRSLALDSVGHPYKFPALDRVRHSKLEFETEERTILHVHKPAMWSLAARQAAIRGCETALVLHAHGVEGFTGGCVLESNCPILLESCRCCPIVHRFARVLPPIGYAERARFLRSVRPVIIANSVDTLRAITASNLTDHCRVEMIPPGTDREVFFKTERAIDKMRVSSPVPLSIGFISYSIENPNKGFQDFVQTARILASTRPTAACAAGLVRLETARQNPDVHFLGPLLEDSQLRTFYNTLDYLVIPSRSESFGKVSIEAQFCGTPVVCYNIGGLPETVADFVTGLIVPPTPEALAAGILKLEKGVALVKDPADTRVRTLLEKFETKTTNARYAAIYDSLFPCP